MKLGKDVNRLIIEKKVYMVYIRIDIDIYLLSIFIFIYIYVFMYLYRFNNDKNCKLRLL